MPQYLTWGAIEAIARGSYRSLFFGPPGTGKTRLAYNTAEALGKAFYNITLSDETPAAELRGHYVPKGNIWEFMYGPAVRAAVHEQRGAVLLLDEIDKASQDCLDFLHGLLNDPDVSQMTLPSGEILRPNGGFQVIATMNGELDDLPFALQDRFKIAIEITEPHPDAIASLPEDLQGVARSPEAYGIGNHRVATIRAWHAFATLRELPDVTTEDAAKAVFAHRAAELMDAIGFRSSEFTPVVNVEIHDDPEDSEDPCSCSDCTLNRATTYLSFNDMEVKYDDSDGDEIPFGCPAGCDSWYETESEAALCCYDDAEWVQYCRDNGVDHG